MPPEPIKTFTILAVLIALCGTALGLQNPRVRDATGKRSRIQALLIHLADQARSSDNLAFAVHAQVRAATLLWPYESDRARAMFRQAFESLGTGDADRGDSYNQRAFTATRSKLQLRTELLNQVAARDPELAEELARKLVLPLESGRDPGFSESDPAPAAAQGRLDVAKRELLVSVALQIVELDPNRAMTLGQFSLGAGGDDVSPFISPNFPRLLMLLAGVDRSLARLLFSSAVYLFGALGWGVFVSAANRTQLGAFQLGTFTSFLPAFLLSGFIWSIANMPVVIQFIALFVPARYFINIIKGVFLKGVGLQILWFDLLLLVGYAIFVFWMSTRKLRQKVA